MATRKYYNHHHEETVGGWNVGAEHTDENGNKYKCLFSYFDALNLDARGAVPVFTKYEKAVGTDSWVKITPLLKTSVDETEYRSEVLATFAHLVPKEDALEDDFESPIYGQTLPTEEESQIVGYNKKLKDGIVTEAQFFVNAVFKGKYGTFPLDEILFSTILAINEWEED